MVVNKVTRSGSDLILHMSDGARIYAYRTTGSLWYPATNADPDPDPDPDPSGDWAWPFRAWPSDEGGDMPPNGSTDQPLAEFGPRSGIGVGSFHEGMDAGYGAMLAGADVKCAGPGTVAFAAASGAFGNLVKVDHPDGTSSNYAHLASFSVSVGITVEAGTLLGTVGGTGGVAPHLHFETHESEAAAQVPNTNDDGGFRTAVNPRDYMAARGA